MDWAAFRNLGTALGLNMTWGLSLLLLFTIGWIAVKKRTFILPSMLSFYWHTR